MVTLKCQQNLIASYLFRWFRLVPLALTLLTLTFITMGHLFPGDEIAFFIRSRAINYHAHLLDVRAGIYRRLFPHLPNSLIPVWSSDGLRLAFLSRAPGGVEDIYIADSLGRNLHRVAQGHSPTWSPDGTQIAYINGIEIQIAEVNAASEPDHLETIGFQIYYDLAWSPDGNDLAYVYAPEQIYNIYLLNFATGDAEWLAEGRSPSWSPDGMRIVYEYRQQVMIIDLTDREPVYITEGIGPSWSPDGEWLAFSRQIRGRSDLMLRHLDSGYERVLISNGEENFSPEWHPPQG